MVAPQFLLEGHSFQQFHPLHQRRLLIEIPEELRILEPRAQHPLVSVADDRFTFRVHLGIHHGEKVRGELARGVLHGKILLVVAHHRHQHLFRKREVLAFEVAGEHGGPLGQVGDSVDQPLILAPACPRRSGNRPRHPVERLADRVTPRCDIGLDKCSAQGIEVRRRRSDRYRRLPMQNTVPAAQVSGADSANFQRNHFRIEQRHQPADWAHKALRLAGAPVHILGPVDRQHFPGQLSRQELSSRTPFAMRRRRHVLALGVGQLGQRSNFHASLLRKSQRRWARRAIGEGDLPRRPRQLLFDVGLRWQNALDPHRQPPRRGIRRHFATFAQQPLTHHQLAHTPGQFRLG